MTHIPARSRRYATIIGLLLVALLLSVRFGAIPGLSVPLQRLELLAYDLRTQAHLADPDGLAATDQLIVIVDIDEASLRREGRWPWPRRRIAELIDALDEAGAGVIAFDILFAEPERNPVVDVAAALGDVTAPVRERIAALVPAFDGDYQLVNALQGRSVVLGYIFDTVAGETAGGLPAALPVDDPVLVQRLALAPMSGYSAPLPQLQAAAAGCGVFSLLPDPDGMVRRAPLLFRYGDQLYPALALETVRRFLFADKLRLRTESIANREQVEQVLLDEETVIPTDGQGQMLIPYRGMRGSFPYLPAWQVLAGEVDPAQLAGAIVLVGTTARGLFDLRATPVGAVYPGVEVHANLIAAMLDGRHLVEPSWAAGANLSLALGAGLLLAMLLPRLSPLLLVVATIAVGSGIMLVTGWLWSSKGLVLDLASPLSLVLALGVLNLGWGFFFEARTRHRLKAMFGQYVPPELVEEMSKHPDDFSFSGQQRELSVLFSDIRGFTTISESLLADDLKRLLNRYFTPITRVIFQNHGTIDKYVGDMVMAFWGAPLSDPDHAVHAIEAALQMLSETERLRSEFARLGLPAISIGIGINSGTMNVGDMGSEYRRAYTVIGDAVNLASRLEGATKVYGVGLVVGERTRELAAERFVWRELDRVRVKGKEKPVHVFQPLCRREEAGPELITELLQHDAALAAFREQRWELAAALFSALLQENPAVTVYALYLDRIDALRRNPPPADWDGGWVLTEK